MRFLWTIVTLGLLIAPAWLIWRDPTSYTPIVSIILSAALSAASVFATLGLEKARIERDANAKWLPQARSACDRLLTLIKEAQRIRVSNSTVCKTFSKCCEATSNATSIQLVLDQHCSSLKDRLQGVEDHLWSAYFDWHRFIQTNCHRGECVQIFEALEKRQAQLGLQTEVPAATDGLQVGLVLDDCGSIVPPTRINSKVDVPAASKLEVRELLP